jgi:lipid-binding SYLF domain-containing protein
MKRIVISLILLSLFTFPVHASHRKQVERLKNAAEVLDEIMKIPEDSIPQDLLNKAECVVIIPSMKKAAIGVGGNYGRGVLTCRLRDTWSAPVMVQMTGGSFGLQLGGTSIDVVLLIMNKKGVDKLLQSKFTLGGDASVAGGPKGRSAAAATDVQMRAEILSYARSRGLFAGISVNGSVLKASRDDNEDLYGSRIDPKVLLKEGGKMSGSRIAVDRWAESLLLPTRRITPLGARVGKNLALIFRTLDTGIESF